MRVRTFSIGKKQIGSGNPCFIIAEAGVNHNGNPELAQKLIHAAAEAGADAVKFQTFVAERLVTAEAPKAEYQKRTTGSDESQLAMIRKLELPRECWAELRRLAEAKGLVFLSTPFDLGSVDFLNQLGVPAFKVPSGEITHPALLEKVATTGKPVLISTGMSSLAEVAAAVRIMEAKGLREFCLLQCTSNYPANPDDTNLRAMVTLEQEFGVPVGLSDHTEGIEVSIAAVAMGAAVIEKHLTLDRSMEGPDHTASMEPSEFKTLALGIRKVERAMGTGEKKAASSEQGVAQVARRSLVIARDLVAGTVLSESDLAYKRPGTGIPPTDAAKVIGRRTTRALSAGALLSWDDLAA